MEELYCELNCYYQKIRQTLVRNIRKHWTTVLTLLGLISSVYHDLHHWRSNPWPHIAEAKLYNWATSPYCTQAMSNQLVMVIVRPINLNVCCKLGPYSFQRTWSPPEPHLPKRIRNMQPFNYYDLKGKDIDVHYHYIIDVINFIVIFIMF